MAKEKCTPCTERLNKVGGQAVLEGVMMKAGERTVTSLRLEDGTISVIDDTFVSVRKKNKLLNLPLIRGFINFIEMMKLSFKTLEVSAAALGLDEEEDKKDGKVSTTDLVMFFGMFLGLLLALGLFMVLPSLIADGIEWVCTDLFNMLSFSAVTMAVIEGFVKIGIFLGYLSLVILMPDIRRTFMYHGAEHKSIACFEAGEELTPENAMKHRRFHPRCGTSFMFLMIAIGIFIGMFIRFALPSKALFPSDMLYSLTVSGLKILLLPITMGIGYEILMLAGKHDNLFTRIVSAPGIWVQRLTTKEPTLEMLEIAITSIKCALRDEFPEYMQFYLDEGWKTEAEKEKERAEAAECDSTADTDNSDSDAVAEESAEESAEEIAGESEVATATDFTACDEDSDGENDA